MDKEMFDVFLMINGTDRWQFLRKVWDTVRRSDEKRERRLEEDKSPADVQDVIPKATSSQAGLYIAHPL
jgi:hypothetical protein